MGFCSRRLILWQGVMSSSRRPKNTLTGRIDFGLWGVDLLTAGVDFGGTEAEVPPQVGELMLGLKKVDFRAFRVNGPTQLSRFQLFLPNVSIRDITPHHGEALRATGKNLFRR